jgi:glycosyltransferase involved in cell wall biosynthesis
MRAGDQLIIVDDASPDGGATQNYLFKKFIFSAGDPRSMASSAFSRPMAGIEIVVAINEHNLRFGATVNFGFQLAKRVASVVTEQ